jgi:hypothetical protein
MRCRPQSRKIAVVQAASYPPLRLRSGQALAKTQGRGTLQLIRCKQKSTSKDGPPAGGESRLSRSHVHSSPKLDVSGPSVADYSA